MPAPVLNGQEHVNQEDASPSNEHAHSHRHEP
jgi:hypothetical protein